MFELFKLCANNLSKLRTSLWWNPRADSVSSVGHRLAPLEGPLRNNNGRYLVVSKYESVPSCTSYFASTSRDTCTGKWRATLPPRFPYMASRSDRPSKMEAPPSIVREKSCCLLCVAACTRDCAAVVCVRFYEWMGGWWRRMSRADLLLKAAQVQKLLGDSLHRQGPHVKHRGALFLGRG